MPSKKLNPTHAALIHRYLIWDYKETREAFERIERKTTQLVVDQFIYSKLPSSVHKDEFQKYILQKQADELKLKYNGENKKTLNDRYQYLEHRLKAIESAIVHFLGLKELKTIEKMFEEEFTRRIMESKGH